jgi:hypothetical protein
MIGGYIARNIARTTRKLLIVNGIIVAGCVVILVLLLPWLTTVFRGPKVINVGDVGQIRDAGAIKDWYVSVDLDADRFLPQYYKVSGRKSGTRTYWFYPLKEGTLIVQAGKTDDPPRRITGNIRAHTSEVTSKVLSNVPRGVRRPVLPVIVQSDNPKIGVWVAAAFWAPFFGIGLWNLVKGAKRLSDQNQHPIVVNLAKMGSPEQLAAGIDAEMAAGHLVIANVHVTRSWLCRQTGFGLDLFRLDDVVWAYRKQTKHYTNGIPTGTTHSTVVCDRHGRTVEMQLKKTEQVDELLAAISAAAPHALFGFDEQLAAIWQKNKAEVIAAADERRRQRERHPVAAPAAPSTPPTSAPPVPAA